MSEADPKQSFGFRRRLALARAAAAVEAVWPALWPAIAIVGLFLVVSLFGLWAWLPGWLHAFGLFSFAGALGYAVWRAWPVIRWPSRDAGLGRLERVNALAHQPLRSMGDRLSGGAGDPGTLSLWQRHRERLLRSLSGLRVGSPRSDLPRRDPWALRAALMLVLVIAVVEAGSMLPDRLGQAFELQRPDRASVTPVELIVWVTPPAYTGLPPVRLAVEPASVEATSELINPFATVEIPVGSEALAQIHHLRGPASAFSLTLEEEGQQFTGAGRQSAEARLTIEESGELKVASGAEQLGSWHVQAIADQPPEIAFAGTPGPTQRSALRVGFEAADDYGIASIALTMHRPDAEAGAERLELMRPATGAAEVSDTTFLDLTPHPWAGLPVVVQLEAVDGIEQVGESEAVEIILPAREFQHPLARAIIEERRQLAADPERRDDVANALNRLSQNPDFFQQDLAVYLALRSAAQRLLQEEGEESLQRVLALLWDTALHLEDGSLSIAERQLRELERALRNALEQGASDEELERLMAELERAMEAYLDELMRQAQEMMAQDHEMMPIDPNAMQVRREDFQQMLDMMREMIRTGAREAAQQMLAQLQEMLENLQVAQQGQMSQGQEMMNQLQEMIQRQQSLLDQTYGLSREQQQQDWTDQQGEQGQFGQEGQQGEQGQFGQGQQGQFGQQQGQMGQGRPGGQQGGAQSGQLAMDQEALRRALGELMNSLGDAGMQVPRSLGGAELAMRGARDALQGGQPGEAVDPQAQALDLLRQGGQAMLQDMQQMYGQGQQGEVAGQPFGQNPDGRDPLGRSMYNQGGADLFGERVPTELDLGRARAIMEELHRRSSQRSRPPDELDYLQRLLKRF